MPIGLVVKHPAYFIFFNLINQCVRHVVKHPYAFLKTFANVVN